MRIAILDSHPIQYHAPWFRELSRLCELEVLFAHRQSSEGQARAGYGVAFEWDVDLVSGYPSRFLRNIAADPGTHHFGGCDTPEIVEIIAAGRYDAVIVTGWFLKSWWQAVYACKRARVPVLARGDSQLTTPRSALVRRGKTLLYPLMLRSFDGFLSPGTRNREYLIHYRVPEERIFHVPHMIDGDRFRRALELGESERNARRHGLGAAAHDRIALCVGRLIPLKRYGDVLEAIARLARCGGPRWVAVLAGAGPEQAVLQAQAEALGVAVRFLGFVNQSELPALYAAADVLVLSSDSETWGLVVNEAMAAGTPAVVSSLVGCKPDMIEEGLTGFSYSCGDVAALADVLHLARDLRRSERTQAALARVTAVHSPSAAARATLAAAQATAGRAR